jgi:uncharacterized surface protein with fasciclin (FAS1) repeats
MNGFLKFSAIAALALGASACSDDTDPLALEASLDRIAAEEEFGATATSDMTIAEIVQFKAEEEAEFTALLDAVLGADPAVLQTLSGKGKFTVFAPTDAAFEALAATGALDGIDQATLTSVLLYHVSRGAEEASEILAKQQLRMLSGDFARIDGAMEMINQATIIDTDIRASNGIIHVIDAVLLPPSEPQQGNKNQPTIFDLVAELGEDESPEGFSVLKAAVLASGDAIPATLDGNGQFTVFAPNNQAFLDLISDLSTTPEELLANDALLTQVLLYHVTRGSLNSSEVTTKDQLRMLDGNTVRVNGTSLNDDTTIIATDFETRNGIVHVIDKVLLPPTL